MSKEAEAKTGFTPVLRRCAGCGSELPEFGRYRAFFDAPDERCHDDDVCVKLRNDRLDATRLRRAAADDLYEALEAHEAWQKSEDEGPQYPRGISRDHGGEAIWRTWWDNNLCLCDRANRLTKDALARARGENR